MAFIKRTETGFDVKEARQRVMVAGATDDHFAMCINFNQLRAAQEAAVSVFFATEIAKATLGPNHTEIARLRKIEKKLDYAKTRKEYIELQSEVADLIETKLLRLMDNSAAVKELQDQVSGLPILSKRWRDLTGPVGVTSLLTLHERDSNIYFDTTAPEHYSLVSAAHAIFNRLEGESSRVGKDRLKHSAAYFHLAGVVELWQSPASSQAPIMIRFVPEAAARLCQLIFRALKQSRSFITAFTQRFFSLAKPGSSAAAIAAATLGVLVTSADASAADLKLLTWSALPGSSHSYEMNADNGLKSGRRFQENLDEIADQKITFDFRGYTAFDTVQMEAFEGSGEQKSSNQRRGAELEFIWEYGITVPAGTARKPGVDVLSYYMEQSPFAVSFGTNGAIKAASLKAIVGLQGGDPKLLASPKNMEIVAGYGLNSLTDVAVLKATGIPQIEVSGALDYLPSRLKAEIVNFANGDTIPETALSTSQEPISAFSPYFYGVNGAVKSASVKGAVGRQGGDPKIVAHQAQSLGQEAVQGWEAVVQTASLKAAVGLQGGDPKALSVSWNNFAMDVDHQNTGHANIEF